MFGFSGQSDGATQAHLRRIERKLDALMQNLGITLPDDGMQDLRDLAASGRKIEAIKLYRERTGAGLKEAKDAVEAGL